MSPQLLITGTMVLALPMFYAIFLVPAGSPLYFVCVTLAGALINAGLPLMVVAAQDLAPHAVGTASGTSVAHSSAHDVSHAAIPGLCG